MEPPAGNQRPSGQTPSQFWGLDNRTPSQTWGIGVAPAAAEAPVEPVDTWRLLEQDVRFVDLMRLQRAASKAMTDPSFGDYSTYLTAIEDLENELLRDTGLDKQPDGQRLFRRFISEKSGFDLKNETPQAVVRGLNLIANAAGLLDFQQLPGDVFRNFTANLWDAQAERLARDNQVTETTLSQGQVLNPTDYVVEGRPVRVSPRVDAAIRQTGPPPVEVPSNFSVAVQTIGNTFADSMIASVRTIEDLGLARPPTKFTDTFPYIGLDKESWVVTYMPSIIFGKTKFGSSPQDNPLRIDGEMWADRVGWLDRCENTDNPAACRMWIGLGTELATDPYVWVDVARLGARVTRGFATAFGQSAGGTAVNNFANQLDEAAEVAYNRITPAGVARSVGSAVNLLPFSPVTHVSDMVTRGINAVLDIPTPGLLTNLFLPRNMREASGTMGWNPNDIGSAGSKLPPTDVRRAELSPRIRDLLFSQGAPSWVNNPRIPSWARGGPDIGLSPGDIAIGRENAIRSVAARGATEVNAALNSGLTSPQTFRFPWIRASVPNAQIIRPEFQAYVNGMHAITRDILDTTGNFQHWGRNADINDRIVTLAGLHGMDVVSTKRRITEAVEASRRVILQTGYHVSGYPEFVTSMRTVTEDMINQNVFPGNPSVADVRRAYEQMTGGVDLQKVEINRGIVMGMPERTGAQAATAAGNVEVQNVINFWQQNPAELQRWETEIGANLAARGREDLSGITWREFLDGQANGYVRREFEGINNPERMFRALTTNNMVVMRDYDQATVEGAFDAAFGAGAGAVVTDMVKVMTPAQPRNVPLTGPPPPPSLSLRTDHLAQMLSIKLGRQVSTDEVARVVYAQNSNAQFLMDTLDLLRRQSQSGFSSSTMTTPFSMTPQPFEPRLSLDLEQIAQLGIVDDPAELLAAMGVRAGRQVRSQTMLTEFYDNLSQSNLIVNPQTVGMGISPRNTQAIFPFQTSTGDSYVILPDNAQAWGPLANQAIPEDMARLITYAMTVDRGNSGFGARLMGMWRRGLVSPLRTAVRNMFGDLQLANQAGADMGNQFSNLRRAHNLRGNFARTGELPDEFKGYEHLFNYISDTTVISTIEQPLDQMLRDIVTNRKNLSKEGAGVAERAFDQAESFVNWATSSPAVGAITLGGTGFIPLFRWGNEVARTTSFLTVHDSLRRAGVNADEAINRAAHFASNASFNYGATPLLPEALRRTGFSAFPQFRWFNIGRQVRTAAENPSPLIRTEYARQAANIAATDGDEGDQEALTQVQNDWMRFGHPLVFPVRQEDGTYDLLDLEQWFPQYSNLTSLFYDPFTLPAVGAIVDVASAYLTGTGKGVMNPLYPREVFNPGEPLGVRLRQSAGFLGSQYVLPGVWTQYEKATEAMNYANDPEAAEKFALVQGRLNNVTPTSFALSSIGLGTTRFSVLLNSPTYQSQMRNIETHYQTQLAPLEKELGNLTATIAYSSSGSGATLEQEERRSFLQRRILALNNEKLERELSLRDTLRGPR